MSATLLLVCGLSAIFAGLVVAAATVGVLTREHQQVARSLLAVRALSVAPDLAADAHVPFASRVLLPAMERLGRFGRLFTPAGRVERIAHRLELAGSPAGWDTERVLAVKMLGLIGGGAAGLLVPAALGVGATTVLVLAVMSGTVGFLALDVALRVMTSRRQERLARELPDALDLLTISVEAGLGFDAAMAQVARNTEGPLADEFFRVLQEMQIGSARSEAMRALADRTEVPELRGFITAVVQADGFGIPIANVLRVQAREMRLKRTQRAEEQAQKVPVKILFPLIFCILPALFVVVLGPAAISVIRNFKF